MKKKLNKCTLFECQCSQHESTNIGDTILYVSNERWDQHFTWSKSSLVFQYLPHCNCFVFFYPQCLLFTAMPFAEDLRQFSFAPLDANKKWKPTGNLYNLCLNLIAIKLDPKRVFLMHGLNESYIFCKRNERQLS